MRTPSLPRPALLRSYGAPEMPLPEYAGLVATYSMLLGSFLRAAPRGGFPLRDLLLLAVATHKLARLITLDRVTSAFRAPFTRFTKSAGAGEVEEEARGEGVQRALGELVTCPYCFSPWAALALLIGYRVAPAATREGCRLLAVITGAHFLNQFYALLKNQNE